MQNSCRIYLLISKKERDNNFLISISSEAFFVLLCTHKQWLVNFEPGSRLMIGAINNVLFILVTRQIPHLNIQKHNNLSSCLIFSDCERFLSKIWCIVFVENQIPLIFIELIIIAYYYQLTIQVPDQFGNNGQQIERNYWLSDSLHKDEI